MKQKEPRSLQDILANQTDSIFSRLARQQSQNDTLLDRLRAVLPSHFAHHLVAVTYREQVLVLVADSAAWANRIRYETESIKKYWEQTYPDAESKHALQRVVVQTAVDKI